MAELRTSPAKDGTKLELVEGDEVVSGLTVVERLVRVGDIPVRCGGIAGVYTQPQHRMKGYARQLLEGSISFMQEAGHIVSALFGIPAFYPKFGFAPILPGVRATVDTRDAELARPRYTVRPARLEDSAAMARIYETMHAHHTGTCVRDPQTWPGFRIGSTWSNRIDSLVVCDGAEILGYACYELDLYRCEFSELGYRTPAVFETLVAEAAKQALKKRVEHIVFHAPFDDPFLRYCRRYGCKSELTYARQAHGMGRVIDQTALLELLQPLLTQRLAAAGVDWPGSLTIETDLGRDTLQFGQRECETRVCMPQWMLAQLVLGYHEVGDALYETEAHADDAAVPILQAIFPAGFPYIYATDRF